MHALIPVKGLANGKSRLMPPYTAAERAGLVRAMLARVIAAAQDSGRFARITVISPDTVVLAFAEECGVAGLVQRSIGLNPALDEGRADARARGATAILVLHADLPRLTGAEIAALCDLLPASPAAVLAPDHTGTGTNALLLAPPDALPFQFGTGSFARHIAAAQARGLPFAIARAPGIAGDIDTPDDVRQREGRNEKAEI